MIQAIHFIILFFTILSYFFYICNKVIKYRFKSNDGSLKDCPKCAQPILKSVADTSKYNYWCPYCGFAIFYALTSLPTLL